MTKLARVHIYNVINIYAWLTKKEFINTKPNLHQESRKKKQVSVYLVFF